MWFIKQSLNSVFKAVVEFQLKKELSAKGTVHSFFHCLLIVLQGL